MPKAFYKNAFDLNEFGHGGEKRSFQIHQLFTQVFDLVPVKAFKSVFSPWYVRYFAGLEFLIRHRLLHKQYKQLSLIGFHIINFKHWFKHHPDAVYFIWEPHYSYEDFYIPLLCKQYGLKVLVLPHNLESLVSNRQSSVSGQVSPEWFLEELTYLKLCDVVFTISLEDQWLLSLYGFNVKYLEYIPPSQIAKQSSAIANHRIESAPGNFYLMLGTALNAPTAEGMRAVIDFIIKNDIQIDLQIAGYGTEQIGTMYPSLPKQIKILGSLDNDALIELLKKCRAVLIYQNSGSGVLTKIPELLMSGIPVIANRVSLRSFQNVEGLHAIDNLTDLERLNSINLKTSFSSNEVYRMRREEQNNWIKKLFEEIHLDKKKVF